MLSSMSDDHDQPDPAEALMREVGAQLRQVRLERGEELDEVAQQLRIKATYLFGIEQGDLSTIPGRTYALGFLRSYADYLGFDGDDLITQIKSTVANLTDRTRLRLRTPLPENRLPRTPLLVLSLAAVAGIYTGWSYVNHGSQLVIETVAEVPGNLRDLAFGAFRERGAPSTPDADADGARPAQTAALTGAVGHDTRPSGARAAPMPERDAAAPAPESRAPAERAAAADPPGPRLPTAAIEPGAPPVRAVGPEAGPGPATDAVRADAAPGPSSTATAPTARAAAVASPAPNAAAPGAAPEPPTVTPDQPVAPAAAVPGAAPRPAVVAAAPAATELADKGASDGAEPAPVTTPAPGATAPPVTSAMPAAPVMTDAEARARQEQLAALPLDPATLGPVGRIHEPDNSDARVVIRALESSWIHISSPGGDYLRDRTLEPNDVFLVPNRPDLQLWTGNAGGLEMIVDGTVLAPLGTSGAVLRDVPLDPSSLRQRLGRPPAR